MKIVSWNCRSGFTEKKALYIDKYSADIYVIQECTKENVDTLKDFKKHSIWYGDNIDGKYGIGIFSDTYSIELLPEMNPDFRYVIPFRVYNINHSFILFAVWTKEKDKNSKNIKYTKQTWNAINFEDYKNIFNGPVILVGDFNSNNFWDNEYQRNKVPTHNDIINKLKEYNIESAYHKFFNCEDGFEKDPTLLWQNQTFHIDYCFVSSNFEINNVQIESVEELKNAKLSDHCPLIVDVEVKK